MNAHFSACADRQTGFIFGDHFQCDNLPRLRFRDSWQLNGQRPLRGSLSRAFLDEIPKKIVAKSCGEAVDVQPRSIQYARIIIWQIEKFGPRVKCPAYIHTSGGCIKEIARIHIRTSGRPELDFIRGKINTQVDLWLAIFCHLKTKEEFKGTILKGVITGHCRFW